MHNVFRGSLSDVWKASLLELSRPAIAEITPLIVSINEFDSDGRPKQCQLVRKTLDNFLIGSGKQTVSTVANTIFPESLWNPNAAPSVLYDRYRRILPSLRKASTKNRRGLYFERMITGGPRGAENQLDFILAAYKRRSGTRRSILQVAIFQPSLDHSNAALLGFPCLQHITFAPTSDGLNVNAFYAVQYIAERAYGNYLGLCRLGRFVAHVLGLPLATVTCVAGVAELDIGKHETRSLLKQMELETKDEP
jgi:hypothetical protein